VAPRLVALVLLAVVAGLALWSNRPAARRVRDDLVVRLRALGLVPRV
jgi:hypothetical protein